MKHLVNATGSKASIWLKCLYGSLVGASLVLCFFAAQLPSFASELNAEYWMAHFQPYYWRLLTDGEGITLGMGFQALVGVAVYGILTQAMPRTLPFYRWLRWVLRGGLLLSFILWPFWVLTLLFF
jgi:hypothetical protein